MRMLPVITSSRPPVSPDKHTEKKAAAPAFSWQASASLLSADATLKEGPQKSSSLRQTEK
jgi:hypothetical protein